MVFQASVLQSAKRLAYCLPIPGVVAAITYLLTLSRGVYPGISATLVAEASGVIPPSEAAHPIFAGVARVVASIDLFSLPVRLNLLSAFCGTLCAMLIYHLVSRLILLSACEDAGGGGTDELLEENDDGEELPPEVTAYNGRMVPIALTGGLVAAAIFIFMVPVWSAATRLDKGLFDLLLALSALSLFPLVDTPFRWLRLAFSGFLFILGLFDSAVFLLLLPCYAVFMFRAFLSSDNQATIMAGLLAAGLVGSTLGIYAYSQNSAEAHGLSLVPLLNSYVHALSFSHYRELMSFFPRLGWPLVVVQTGAPALILLFGKQILFKDKRMHTVVVLLLLTGVAMPGLLNLHIAPFFIFQPISYLPVFEAAILAATTAMILAACLVFFQTNEEMQEQLEADKDLEEDPSPEPWLLRGIVGVLLPILAVMVLVVPFRSFHETDRQSLFADETARAMLDQMKGRTWLISNGNLDNHLLIQASIRKQPLSLVTLRPQAQPKESARIKRLIAESPDFEGQNRQRLQNALSLGSVRFVREWFMADPEAGRRAMVFATPDLWTSSGYVAVPEGLAFGGIHSGQKPRVTNLVEVNRVFIGRVLPQLLLEDEGTGPVAALSEVLRMKLGLAANELGVLLEEQGEADAAYQAYSQASQIDPDNMSAVVNGYVLASAQKMNSEEISRLRKKFKALTAGRNDQDQGITAIFQNYGTIRQPAFYQQQVKMGSSQGSPSVATKTQKALALSVQTGVQALIENASYYVQAGDPVKAEACYRAALEKDPSSPTALAGMSLLMVSQNKIEETQKWVKRALDAGVEQDTMLYPIITLAILEKDNLKALRLLEEATQKFPEDLRYWTLQADVLLGLGDLLLVEKSVLPAMKKALKNPDHFLVNAIRGSMLKKKGADYFEEARLSLLRALSINAAMLNLWDSILELDLAIGKPEFTEADVRDLLNVEPDHALANNLMGSLLLSRGKLQESEDFLRRSLEKAPTSAVCNDLGENLRRQQKLAEAETFVRRALEIEPGRLLAMDTLASVLCDAGKYEEAVQLAVKALTARPDHSDFQLTLLRIHLKQGNSAGVKEQLKVLAALQTPISEALQKEIDVLMKNKI